MSAEIVIFSGPTLPPAEVEAALPCRCPPPARQGDVWRAVRRYRPLAIGLIDGVFLDVPAVWHREILWALSQGVHVLGAASMGALRAAELLPFGMQGVGRVFEAFRDGVWPGFPEPFEDDDEVAVVHAPAEVGGAPLSDAMVDLRATLLAAEAAGVIGRADCLGLAAAMKRRHFPDRSCAALAEAAPAALRAWLPGNAVRQKRDDARALLHRLAALRTAAPPPFRPTFRFERALVWERFEAQAIRAERVARQQALAARADTWSLRPEDIEAWLR